MKTDSIKCFRINCSSMKLLTALIFIANFCYGQTSREKVFIKCFADCHGIERIFLSADGYLRSQRLSEGMSGMRLKKGKWLEVGDTMKVIPKNRGENVRDYLIEKYSGFVFLVSQRDHVMWDGWKTKLDESIRNDSTYQYFSKAPEYSIAKITATEDVIRQVFYSGDHPAEIYISDLLYEIHQQQR